MLGAMEARLMKEVRGQFPEWMPKHTLVLSYIFAHMNPESWECWPSQEDIAAYADLSLDTVQRALKDLEWWRVLSWKRGGNGLANTYRVLPEMRDNLQNLADKDLLRNDLVAELQKRRLVQR